ncbi:MAG: hypothetical protein LLG04_00195 [Parachlamydia sp.]|nr:hypothetical protein [Parachlamydia sp.]
MTKKSAARIAIPSWNWKRFTRSKCIIEKAKVWLSLSSLLLFFITASLSAAEDSEETQSLRRILAFLQDGDMAIAQMETRQFFAEYPSSLYRDQLHLLWGDRHLRDQHYTEAYDHFIEVQDPSLRDKAILGIAEIKSALGDAQESVHTLLLRSERSPEQQAFLEFHLGRTYFIQGRHEEVLATLAPFLKSDKHLNDPAVDKSILTMMVASACQIGKTELMEKLAERHIAHYPDDKRSIHLSLFDAYLQVAGRSEDKALLDQAAEHLYQAGPPVKQENLFWLAGHWIEKGNLNLLLMSKEESLAPGSDMWARRTQENLQMALGDAPSQGREREWLMLCTLHGCFHQHPEQIRGLEALLQFQLEPGIKSHALYRLARAYETEGNRPMAMKRYQELIDIKPDPSLANSAKLNLARLIIASLKQPTLDNPDVLAALKTLKDLQMRRQLQYEPVHLEAAIDYAAFRSSLEPSEKQNEQRRHLLVRIKEEFTGQEGLWAKDYQASRKSLPEKELLYQAYMMLIDAHRLNLEAQLAASKGQTLDAQIKSEAAAGLYKSLIEGKFAVSKYVVDQAISGLGNVYSP